MKRFAPPVAIFVFCLVSSSLLASDQAVLQRSTIARVKSAQSNSFSVEIPVVARIQGSAFFRTAVDINNNTSQNNVSAQYQFSYTCLGSGCPAAPANFFRTSVQTIVLPGLGNFHKDDFIDYLNGLNLPEWQPGCELGCIGTLLVTFSNLPVANPQGWEANAVARTYNHLDEATPTSATVGFAYNASLFFESADTTLVGTARDTETSPTVAGTLRSNVGVRNTDINDSQDPCPSPNSSSHGCVTVVLSFYDVATGQRVGTDQTMTALLPGELRQISNLWATAGIPNSVNQVIIFVDNPSPTSTSSTFEGYVTIVDGGSSPLFGSTQAIATQDASFFEMKCADTNGCGN